jgi:hypothetical protein
MRAHSLMFQKTPTKKTNKQTNTQAARGKACTDSEDQTLWVPHLGRCVHRRLVGRAAGAHCGPDHGRLVRCIRSLDFFFFFFFFCLQFFNHNLNQRRRTHSPLLSTRGLDIDGKGVVVVVRRRIAIPLRAGGGTGVQTVRLRVRGGLITPIGSVQLRRQPKHDNELLEASVHPTLVGSRTGTLVARARRERMAFAAHSQSVKSARERAMEVCGGAIGASGASGAIGAIGAMEGRDPPHKAAADGKAR